MRLKYYLRGLGIGIIVTTIILMISFAMKKDSISDEEIMKRAAQLGMIMPEEDSLFIDETENPEQSSAGKGAEDQENQPAPENSNAGKSQDLSPEEVPEDQQKDAETGEDTSSEGTANGGAGNDMQNAGTAGNPDEKTGFYRIEIKRGDVCRTVCEELAANGVIDDSEALRKYLSEIGYASSITIGEYDIPYGKTFEEIADVFKAGPIEEEKLQ